MGYSRRYDAPVSDWQAAKKSFEQLTGQKKPSEKFLGIFRKSSGVENALISCGRHVLWNIPIKDQAKSTEDLKKVVNDYLKMLDAAIRTEKSKETQTALLNGLRVLKTSLQKYVANYEAALAEKQAKTGEVEKVRDFAVKYLASGVAACNAAAKRIIASPTAEVYNREMIHADTLRVALEIRIPKAIDQGAEALKDPAPYVRKMEPYYDGHKRRVSPGTDAKMIQNEITEFVKVIKEIQAAYAVR
jgi:hypothetical protein